MFQSFHQLQETCENGRKLGKSKKLRRILTCNCDAPQNRNDMSSLQSYQHSLSTEDIYQTIPKK